MTTLIVDTLRELRNRVNGAMAPGLPGSEHYARASRLLGEAADALEEGHRVRYDGHTDPTEADVELRGELIRARVRLERARPERAAHLRLVS